MITTRIKKSEYFAFRREMGMKPLKFIMAIIFLAGCLPAHAEIKTFIKEYTYQASDFDSKISSRTIALEQVRRLLLEEVGTFLISETEVKNFQLTRDKITTLSAGVVQTEILTEKWDGRIYYLKAKVSLDPQDVTKLLVDLRDNNQKNRELEETNRKVDEAFKKIKELQSAQTTAQTSKNQQIEYSKAIDELKSKEWLDKGLALMNEEKYAEALNAFSQATEINPTSVWANIDKGWAHNTLGDYDRALKAYDRAAEIDPRNPYIYVNRGMSYNSLGDYQRALLDQEQAIKLDANNTWAYIGRARAYLGIGNFHEALTDLNKAAQLDPGNSFVYSTRVWAHNALGNRRLAMDDLYRSLSLAPNNSWMNWNAAVFYALSGEKSKALTALAKAIRFNSNLKQNAKMDKNLQSLWNDEAFIKLVE